jgi:hypothetical protein
MVRHLYFTRLPEGTPLPLIDTKPQSLQPTKQTVESSQLLYAAVLALALVTVAVLGIRNDVGDGPQTTAAIIAVFLGAVATLQRDLGAWFHGSERAAVNNIPLTCSGSLVLFVGAAFLVS